MKKMGPFRFIGSLIGLAAEIAIAMIPFFVTGSAFGPSFQACFTAQGFATAKDYIFVGTNWDRWLISICCILNVLFTIIVMVVLIKNNKVFNAFRAFLGMLVNLFIAYLYFAWPDHATITWNVFLYILFILYPLATLSKLALAKK